MPFTFEPTGSATADSFLSRSAHFLETQNELGRKRWLTTMVPETRKAKFTGDVDAFSKHLAILTLERWADEVWDGDTPPLHDPGYGDEDGEDDDRRYGSYEQQNRLTMRDVL